MTTNDTVEQLASAHARSHQDQVDLISKMALANVDEEPVSIEKLPTPEPEPLPPPKVGPPFRSGNVFEHHDAHPILIDMVLLKKYGPQWLGWEQEVIWEEIKEDFHHNVISVLTRHKINAIKTCHIVDSPWTAWEVFALTAQPLNNNLPDFRSLQKPTIPQIIAAADMMSKIHNRSFSEEVAQFIAACFLDEGVIYLPPPLSFAQQYASNPKYVCTKCKHVDHDTENDMCDSCGAPQASLIKKYERDPTSTEQRYKQIMSQGTNHDILAESPEDVQVAKLLVANDYLLYKRQQLAAQIEAVKDDLL